MPAFYTHYTFVNKNTDPKDKYARIRALGGQGPDVFFFYGYSLAKREKKSQTRYFGTYLHHINIADAYSFLLEYAAGQDDSEMLFSYLKGLFMHYVMDRNCHPYIFYRTGFSNKKEEATKYMNYHVGFEAILDLVCAKKAKTLKHPSKCAKCKDEEVKSVSRMFNSLAKYLKFDDIEELSYFNAYKDLLFAESILYSPLGVKKFLIHHSKIKNTQIDCMCMPNKTKPYEKYDLLNLQENEWLDCVSGQTHNETFLQLVENAKSELPKVDELIAKASRKEDIKQDMINFINNIDHDGFEVNTTKVHYQVYSDLEDKK